MTNMDTPTSGADDELAGAGPTHLGGFTFMDETGAGRVPSGSGHVKGSAPTGQPTEQEKPVPAGGVAMFDPSLAQVSEFTFRYQATQPAGEFLAVLDPSRMPQTQGGMAAIVARDGPDPAKGMVEISFI